MFFLVCRRLELRRVAASRWVLFLFNLFLAFLGEERGGLLSLSLSPFTLLSFHIPHPHLHLSLSALPPPPLPLPLPLTPILHNLLITEGNEKGEILYSPFPNPFPNLFHTLHFYPVKYLIYIHTYLPTCLLISTK